MPHNQKTKEEQEAASILADLLKANKALARKDQIEGALARKKALKERH